MSSSVDQPEAPTASGGHTKTTSGKRLETDADREMADTSCGIGCVRPAAMTPCANIGLFTIFYSLAALATSSLSTYVTSQITTLERQFGFSSQQTGLIMAANDIGYLVCVLFVSYTASRVHIPRSLGVATVIFGVSGIACSLPHFIFGASDGGDSSLETGNVTTPGASARMKSLVFGDLCDSFNISYDSCAAAAAIKAAQSSIATPEQVAKASFIIIVIGMMMQGFGKAPRTSFTLTYLDDNTAKVNTGFYMGIVMTVSMLGPASAFLLGGLLSKMYVTLKPTNLTPRHPRWIGAWWLGYVLFGCLALLVSVPLFCFPRRMPPKASRSLSMATDKETETKGSIDKVLIPKLSEKDTKTQSESHHGNQTKKVTTRKLFSKFMLKHSREFLTTLFRLMSNPIYICMVASTCFLIFTIGGSSAYSPKYMERMFHLPTHLANYIIAGQTLCTSSIGTLAGGYLTRRMKMSPIMAMKFTIMTLSVALGAQVMGFFFQCHQSEVHNWPSQANTCSDECSCRDNSYFPVCGVDGRTYYSPCQAGCGQVNNGAYQNCTCIPGGEASAGDEAVGGGGAAGGTCDLSCPHLYAYVLFMGARSLFGTLSIIPKMIVFIRCVSHKDRPLALGFSSFVMSLIGWMLGPIVFGFIIDGVCTVWDITCQVRGRCLRYDNSLFRVKLHGFGAVGFSLSLVCIILAFVYAWWTKCLEEVDGEKAEGTTVEMLLMGQQKTELGRDKDSGNSDSV